MRHCSGDNKRENSDWLIENPIARPENKPMIHSSTCITLMALLLVLSCGRQVEDISDSVPTVTLSSLVKDTARLLIPERELDFPVSALQISVWKDSVSVVRNGVSRDNMFLEFRTLYGNKHIKSLFHAGNGPDEMLSFNFDYQSDSVVARDFMRNNIAIIPIDSVVFNPDYRVRLKKADINTQYLWPFKGGLLAVNPFCFRNDEIGVNNDGFRFIQTDSSYTYKEEKEYEYRTFNVTCMRFIISYDNDRIAVYNSSESEVEIYDTELNLLKIIKDPEMPHGIKYYINKYNYVSYYGEVPQAYFWACSNNNHFYLAYNGDFTSGNEKTIYDLSSWVFKFDWDGNFVDSYYVDHFVSSMSLSSDGQSMYIFGLNHDGENIFYKARLT